MNISYSPIAAESTRELRHIVLRPDQPFAATKYPLDGVADTLHVGAYAQDTLIGVGSVFHESPDGKIGQGLWRLRGMAVLPEFRGRGIGAVLLAECETHARSFPNPTRLWCNARTTALAFYRKCGFDPQGEEFDLPGIGAHWLLVKALAP